jgi:hypothetical protein
LPARRLAVPLLFTFLLALPSASQEIRPRVRVRLYDYVSIRGDILEEAQRQATHVLAQAGVETEWMACNVPALPEPDQRCDQSVGAPDVVLSFLPRNMAVRFHQPKNAVGVFHDRPGRGT